MASRDQVGPELHGIIEKGPEFNLTVAEDVGVGCSARSVLAEKVLEHIVPIFCREVCCMEGNAQLVCNGLRVGKVLFCGAIFGAVVFLPVLHEQALYIETLLDQYFRGDRGIHAAGHADDDGLVLLGEISHGNYEIYLVGRRA